MPYNEDIKVTLNYERPTDNLNIAEQLTEKEQTALGQYLWRIVQDDQSTRTDWLTQNSNGLKLAAQIREEKNVPWKNASNVKYPLVTTAALQFNSRALPAFINSGAPVKTAFNGKDDEQQTKQSRAARVAAHMSWQCMEEDPAWVDDTDRLLMILPISGHAHRKRYYDTIQARPASRLVLPQDMIISFDASNIKEARRTEIVTMSHNDVRTLEMRGTILESKADPVRVDHVADQDKQELTKTHPAPSNDDVPYTFYEVHWNLDLDADGYKEPYIALIRADSGQLVSLTARWSEGAVEKNDEGKVVHIEAESFYTDYTFIPNPLSNTHGLGFGHLLGPINDSVNTLINQLVDAGTLANLQGGFLGRGLKMKGGQTQFTPGEWKLINTAGKNIRDNVFPLPVKDPSNVLFQLLGLLIQAGENISSVSEMMMGENPGQNTAATTAQSLVEQGMKVFAGIFGRIHRSVGKEYKQLYMLNQKYHDVTGYMALLDDGTSEEMAANDYVSDDLDIKVASDPNLITDLQQLQKEQGIGELVQLGTVNPAFFTSERLRRLGYTPDEIKEAMTMPEPPPPPEILELQLETEKFEHQKKLDLIELDQDDRFRQAEAMKDIADMKLKMAQIGQMDSQQQLEEMKLMLDGELREREQTFDSLVKMSQAAKLDKETATMTKEEPKNAKGNAGGAS